MSPLRSLFQVFRRGVAFHLLPFQQKNRGTEPSPSKKEGKNYGLPTPFPSLRIKFDVEIKLRVVGAMVGGGGEGLNQINLGVKLFFVLLFQESCCSSLAVFSLCFWREIVKKKLEIKFFPISTRVPSWMQQHVKDIIWLKYIYH